MSIGSDGRVGSPRWVRRAGWIALLAAVASTWVSPFCRDLVIGDETKYSRVVEQMRATGSWLVLHLDGKFYGHKPPLHFWILDGASHLFGLESIWTFVLPSLVAFVVLGAFVIAGQRRLFGRGEMIATFVFATFWLSWGLAQSARMDVLFVACVTGAAVEIFRAFDDRVHSPLYAAGVWTGLSVLVKGPVGLLIVVVLFGLESYRRRRKVRGWDIRALLIAVAIPLLWLVPALRAGGLSYARELFVRQTLDRAIHSWVHSQPPWYYIVHFPLTFFPWFAVAVVAAIAAFGTAKKSDRNAAMFCVEWFAAVFVPFSLISGKLDVYMLPAMVPASMLVGWLFDGADERWRRRGVWGEIAALVLLAGTFVAGLTARNWLTPRRIPEEAFLADPAVQHFFWIGLIASAVGMVLAVVWRRDGIRATLAAGLASLVPFFWLATGMMPVLADSITTAPMIRMIENEHVTPSEVALYWTPHLWERSMPSSFRNVHYVDARGLGNLHPAIIVTRRDKAADLGNRLRSYEKFESFHLVGKDFDAYRKAGK